MRPEKLILDHKATTRFSQTITQKLKNTGKQLVAHDISEESIGGFIRNGQFGWIAYGPHIEVFSVKTGNKVANYSFDITQRTSNTLITCVSEASVVGINTCLLMIGVQCTPIGGSLYLFSIQGSRILHRIDVIDRITSCCFVNTTTCQQSCLAKFDGCVAIGTDQGKMFLMDLNLRKCKEVILGKYVYNSESDVTTCQIALANMDFEEIVNSHRQAQKDNLNFGIQLEVLAKAGPILSILSLTPLVTIAVGTEDGQMLLYHLEDLQAYHLAYPPEPDSPLVKLTYIEPTDDPRACVYIWAFHANTNIVIAVMHSISFESKTIQDENYIYENFQSCSPRLTIPIGEKDTAPIACQSISRGVSDEEDEILSLCLLAWSTKTETFMMVFDLNQWYKEQMPHVCDWTVYPSYLAPFPLAVKETPLDVWLNPKTVATFNSIQRPEEHFYPNSLSFNCMKLSITGINNFHWAGLQNKALQRLSSFGTDALLEPDECFTDILEACLIPQFSDQNYHSNPTMRLKQEFLLSMALQYNCIGILKECAKLWADGSHLGNQPSEGLSLSVLTDWIWSQATTIKDCCNNLCVPLFDYSGCTIDARSRKILAHCSRQLKLLADLLNMIVTQCRQNIPDEIFDTLCCQRNSIRMTSEYQEVLQWLLNMGLLPEVAWSQFSCHNSQLSLMAYTPNTSMDIFTPVPYPYRILNEYYTAQRQRFYEIDRNLLMPKTNSCKCLFIDMFIEKECNSHQLRAEWKNGTGDSLYPPPSLQAMLRILLIPGISLENKYMLFVYLFLDLNMALEDERYYRVVQNLIKFPAVFKLNPYLIKTAQAFWNLDHKEFETALDELISPLTNDRYISQWQQELLINSLLIQDMPHFALRVLRAPGPPINAVLEIKTLLANSLVTEAFELQRSKCDENLLFEFYKGCHELKKWNYVLGLVLTEREGGALTKFLQSCGSLLTDNLQLLYLLQRNKYIDAINYLDSLKHKHRSKGLQRKLENTQDLIFSSYKLAMVPSEKELTDIYISIRDRIPKRNEESLNFVRPLSTELNKKLLGNELDVVGGIFHRAILNARATNVIVNQPSVDANENYVPFLSKPQIDYDFFENNNHNPVSYPKPYVPSGKRRKEAIYDNREIAEGCQPAAKRQRTDALSITDRSLKRTMGVNVSLLTSFKSKNADKTDGESPSLSPKASPIHKHFVDDSVNLLSTPVVKNTRLEKRMSGRSERPPTPQSILKHRHTDHGSIASRRSPSPTFTAASARRSVDFDERSFKFKIQNISADSGDDYRLTAIPESIADDDSGSDQMKVSYTSVQARPAIHTTNTSMMSTSTDEFFSPETSNLSGRPIIRTVEEMESEPEDSQEIDEIAKESREATPESQRTPAKRQTRSRSRTPEISTFSPSRMTTRSKSKPHLNESVDSFDDRSEQRSELETSTPLQSIKGRASLRSFKSLTKPLSKTVVESNAIKAFIERNKASKTALNSKEAGRQNESENTDISVSNDLGGTPTPRQQNKPRNILEDNSYVSESFMKRYRNELDSTIQSDNSSFGTTNIQPRRNILHDSSSMETTEWENEIIAANEGESEEITSSSERKKDDTPSSARESEGLLVGNDDVTEKAEKLEQNVAQEDAQFLTADSDKLSSSDHEPLPSETISEVSVSNQEMANKSSIASNESETSNQETERTDSSNYQRSEYRRNILRDDSKVSDTFLRRYNEEINTTVYSETSTVFTRNRDILEDSSPGPQTSVSLRKVAIEGKETEKEEDQYSVTTHREIEIRYQQENESDSDTISYKETDKLLYQGKTESDSNDTINYEHDIKEVDDENETGGEESYGSKESSSDLEVELIQSSRVSSNRNTSDSNIEHSKSTLNESDVINISSSSEESNKPKERKKNTIDLTRSSSDENGKDREGRIPNYTIEDFISQSLDAEEEHREEDVVSANILNEMIYGDLQIDEPVDMANNEAVYFNMGSTSSIGRDQRNDEVLDIPFSANENVYLMNVEPAKSVEPIPISDNLKVIDQQVESDTTTNTIIQDLHTVADIEMKDVSEAEPTKTSSVTDVDNQTAIVDKSNTEEQQSELELISEEITNQTADDLNKAIIADSSEIEKTESDLNKATPKPESSEADVLNKGMVIDSIGAEDTFNTSTTLKTDKTTTQTLDTPESKKQQDVEKDERETITSSKVSKEVKTSAFDEALIQPSTSQAALSKHNPAESATETPRLPAKRLRSNSFSAKSSISDNNSEKAMKRSTRAKSVTADDEVQVRTLRSHKSASKIDIKSENKSPEATSARSRARQQTPALEIISESPKVSTRSTRKKTTSESSVTLSQESAGNRTPKRMPRRKESDSESLASTPSKLSIERDVLATPTTRSRRKLTVQDVSDTDSKLETPTRKRIPRSAKKEDDTVSESSSIASSTRNHNEVKETPEDDDRLSVKSTKSKKSAKATVTPATLPIIKEEPVDPVEYETSSRRLTRGQRATMEKYMSEKRKYHSSNLDQTPSRIMTRRQSANTSVTESLADDQDSELSYAESEASNETRASRASRASKTSNTSKVSRASRATKASNTSKGSRSSKRLQVKKAT